MKFHSRSRTLAIPLALGLALSVGACSKSKSKEAAKPQAAIAPLKVELAPVEARKMPKQLTLTGSVLANRHSEVAANVTGRVMATHVERGQVVKQGQVLAIVDSKAAGFSASAAAAQSQAAASQGALAQTECERADTLFAQNAIAKAEYDRLKTQCSAQLYSANAARANASLAKKLAGDTIIRAPFDGIIGERYVNIGEYVQPPTRVVSLYAVDPVRVQVSVPESAVAMIQEGQEVHIRVAAYPQRDFPATVKYVSPALRPATRDLVAEAVAPNPDGALRPGMFASVVLMIAEEELPTVPVEAIKREGSVQRLYLARDGQAMELVVRTGSQRDGRVAVLEPLTPSDKVVVKPPPGLSDGSAIQ